MQKAPIGIPIVASLAAFILVLLALLAGSRQDFLENVDIVTLNTSELGKNLVSSAISDTQPSSTSSSCGSGLLGEWCTLTSSVASTVTSEVASVLNDIGNDVADELASDLGIQEFYSVYPLDICMGNYEPNATTTGAWRNVKNCTEPLVQGYNISALLDHELGIGPFELNLADLGFTQDLQSDVDEIHKILEAFAIIFIIGVGFTGLALIASILSLCLVPGLEGLTFILNIILSSLAASILVIAALVVTIGAHVAVNKANDKGSDIGLSASVGTTFEALTWSGTGLMIITFVWWVWRAIRFRRGARMRPQPRHTKNLRDSEDTYQTRERPRNTGSWAKFPPMVRWNHGSRFRESSMS